MNYETAMLSWYKNTILEASKNKRIIEGYWPDPVASSSNWSLSEVLLNVNISVRL